MGCGERFGKNGWKSEESFLREDVYLVEYFVDSGSWINIVNLICYYLRENYSKVRRIIKYCIFFFGLF